MAAFVKRRVQENKKQARRELSRTLSLALAHSITSRVTVYKPTGPMYLVFCRLYPSYPQPLRQCLTPTGHLSTII